MIHNDLIVSAPDSTSIAYQVTGQGPALVLTNGLTTSSFFWKYLQPRWRERHTVITWDLPGHGRSGPAKSAASATIEGQPALLARVLEAAGIERAVHVGWSVGCQVVLEFYKQFPEHCDALALLFGPAEHALTNTALPVPGALIHAWLDHAYGDTSAAIVQTIAQGAKLPGFPSLLRSLGLIGRDTRSADVRQLLTDLFHMDSGSGRRLAVSAQAHSALDVLTRMQVPLLIVAGDKDPFAPPARVGEMLHRASPDSEFVRLPNATHTALLDHADQIGDLVDDFLARRLPHAVRAAHHA